MTHIDMDFSKRSKATGTVRLLLAVLVLSFSSHAVAEIDLTNSVKKVEVIVSDAGEMRRKLVDADSVVPGDELFYTITFTNKGEKPVDAGSIVITNPIPESTEYLDGTAFGSGTDILFSVDEGSQFGPPAQLMVSSNGSEVPASAQDYTTIRWTFGPSLQPGESADVSFNVRLK